MSYISQTDRYPLSESDDLIARIGLFTQDKELLRQALKHQLSSISTVDRNHYQVELERGDVR